MNFDITKTDIGNIDRMIRVVGILLIIDAFRIGILVAAVIGTALLATRWAITPLAHRTAV